MATIDIELDRMANAMCADCRERSTDLMRAARQSLDMASLALDELGQRSDPYALVPVRLQDRFVEILELREALERAFGVRIVLTHEVSEDCVVLTNRDLARQVMHKLVENAKQAGASTVRIHYQEQDESVEVVIADDGHGMTAREASTLGLSDGGGIAPHEHGTALVRRLVHQAGGTVAWDGRVNVGTWVTIRLRKQSPDAGAIQPRWGRSAVPDKQARALDDDPQQAEALNTAGLVHDISNDLAAIGIHLDLMGHRSCATCRAQLRSVIEAMRAALDGAKVSIESIGLRSVPTHYGLVPVKQRLENLENAIGAMGDALGLTIELTHDVSDACMVVLSREGNRLVTRRLIENAARSGARCVRIHFQELTDTVEAVFADDGHGMTAVEVEALGFSAQGDHAASAQNVGLVRELIHRIGGTVSWDSRKNIGTWVTIRLRKHVPSGPPQ